MSLFFDGTSDCVEIADAAAVTWQSAGTFDWWSRDADPGGGQVAHRLFHFGVNGALPYFYVQRYRNGTLSGKHVVILRFPGGDNLLWIDSPVADSAWHHMALAWSNGIMRWYIDGAVQATTLSMTYASWPANFSAPTYIGNDDVLSLGWPGNISGVGFWTRELSAGEVAARAAGVPAELMARGLSWSMPMRTGAGADFASLSVTDDSSGVGEEPPSAFVAARPRVVVAAPPTAGSVFDNSVFHSRVLGA